MLAKEPFERCRPGFLQFLQRANGYRGKRRQSRIREIDWDGGRYFGGNIQERMDGVSARRLKAAPRNDTGRAQRRQ